MEFLSTAWAHAGMDGTLGSFTTELSELIAEPTVANVLRAPLSASAALMAAAVAASWLTNVGTQLVGKPWWSCVDTLWSVIPVAYAGIFAAYAGGDARVLLLTGLVALWGARLTYNFARKDGYNGEEDYRWPILRAFFAKYGILGAVAREAFSLAFVAVYQHLLIWAFSAFPVYIAWLRRGTALGPVDLALAGCFLLALGLETFTDEVQWRFQSAKHAMTPEQRTKAGGDFARGFVTSGPFRFSRHLNFFCEQSIWWIVYGFSVAANLASGSKAAGSPHLACLLLNWSAVGAFLLSLLFQGSTWMTELLTAGKYPAYRAYQRTTSRLMPWLPGPSLDSEEGKRLVAEAESGAKRA